MGNGLWGRCLNAPEPVTMISIGLVGPAGLLGVRG